MSSDKFKLLGFFQKEVWVPLSSGIPSPLTKTFSRLAQFVHYRHPCYWFGYLLPERGASFPQVAGKEPSECKRIISMCDRGSVEALSACTFHHHLNRTLTMRRWRENAQSDSVLFAIWCSVMSFGAALACRSLMLKIKSPESHSATLGQSDKTN